MSIKQYSTSLQKVLLVWLHKLNISLLDCYEQSFSVITGQTLNASTINRIYCVSTRYAGVYRFRRASSVACNYG
jgi:hypothetical protein